MHGKKFFAGAVFILHGVLSVDARLSLPSQRSKLNENPSIGYASAWTGRWGNSLGRALLGGSGTENAGLLAQVLHRGALDRGALHRGYFIQRSLNTGRTLHTESFTQRNFYTGKVLHTHRSFYTEKSLYRETLTQRSLHTHRGFYTHTHTRTQSSFYTE